MAVMVGLLKGVVDENKVEDKVEVGYGRQNKGEEEEEVVAAIQEHVEGNIIRIGGHGLTGGIISSSSSSGLQNKDLPIIIEGH